METTKEQIAILWMPISILIFTPIAWKWLILFAFKIEYMLSKFLFLPIEIIPVFNTEYRLLLIAALILPLVGTIAAIPCLLVIERGTIKQNLSKIINTMMLFIISYLILYLINNTLSVSNFVQNIFKVEQSSLFIAFLFTQIILIHVIYTSLKGIERKVIIKLRSYNRKKTNGLI